MTSWASLTEEEGGEIRSQSRYAQGSLGGWADSYLCVVWLASSPPESILEDGYETTGARLHYIY